MTENGPTSSDKEQAMRKLGDLDISPVVNWLLLLPMSFSPHQTTHMVVITYTIKIFKI